MKTKNRSLDRIDLKILRCLQENARVSYVDLAAQVGLSTTPCLERVKRLEQRRATVPADWPGPLRSSIWWQKHANTQTRVA